MEAEDDGVTGGDGTGHGGDGKLPATQVAAIDGTKQGATYEYGLLVPEVLPGGQAEE